VRRLVAVAVLACFTSCAALDNVIPVFDDAGDQVGTTTVGDAAADALDGASPDAAGVIGKLVSGVTGNPALGGAAGVALLGLLGAGAAGLRRKKAGSSA